MIPEGGLIQNQPNCDVDLKGHSKKVMLLKWHPSAEFTLASVSMEGSVKIWDVQNEICDFSYDHLGGVPWCMRWNYEGS